jgi:DNA repair exonuclease SbcCD ATPase subunit
MNASRANWERYEEIIGKIEKLALEIDDNEELSALANNETLPLKQKIKVVEAKIAKLSELNSRLVNLKENYQNYELIKLALDPIKGIPLIFIGCHLKETAKIANNLLDKAYNGRFRIMFEVDDKNFFIRVLTGDGGGLDDVRMASQGETSLTSLSLSLSLIQQSVGGGYNILCLDEVDATLDSNNRSTFVEMLETQMDQLGSEQAFVISHNDQFSDYPVDLILLKGNSAQTEDESWMIGKNVVYDWRTV